MVSVGVGVGLLWAKRDSVGVGAEATTVRGLRLQERAS